MAPPTIVCSRVQARSTFLASWPKAMMPKLARVTAAMTKTAPPSRRTRSRRLTLGSSARRASKRASLARRLKSRLVRGTPSARSTDLLCERLQEAASIVVAEPPLELAAGELACRLDHRALAVQPLGLDRVDPRAPARQPADQEAAATAGLLDRA